MTTSLLSAGTASDSVVLSADGSRAYVAGSNGALKVYDTGSGALLNAWTIGQKLGAIDVSADGSFALITEQVPYVYNPQQSGTETGTTSLVYKVDLASGAVTTLSYASTGSNYVLADVAITAGGKALFTQNILPGWSGWTPLITLDLSTGTFTAGGSSYYQAGSLTPAPDHQTVLYGQLALSSADAYVLSPIGATLNATSSYSNNVFGYAAGVEAYSGSGANGRIAIYTGGKLHLWNGNLGYIQDLTVLHSELSSITGLTFSSDGTMLYALGASAQIYGIRLSDYAITETITVGAATYGVQRWGNELSISPDGSFFLISSSLGILKVDHPTVINGGAASETLNGTSGSDEIYGYDGDDQIFGNDGNDVLLGNFGVDHLDGGNGADMLDGGPGDDILTGGAGPDELYGDEGNDQINGGDGRDYILGEAGNDSIDGGGGNDWIDGGDGNDILRGGAGDDLLFGGLGADTLDGGDGDDLIYYDPADNAATILGGAGIDHLVLIGNSALPAGFDLAAHGFEFLDRSTFDTNNYNSWTEIRDVFDPKSNLLLEEFISWDDRTSSHIEFDATNSQSYSKIVTALTFAGDENNRAIYWDDGKTTFVDYDEDGTLNFSQIINSQDMQGRLTAQQTDWDDGTRTFITYDPTSNQPYDRVLSYQDQAGRTLTQLITWNNGTTTFVTFDAAGSSPYTQIVNTQDLLGRTINQQTSYDDGVTVSVVFDVANLQTYSQIINTVDALGRLDAQEIRYDNGSHSFIDYDQANSESWSQHVTEFDADGTTILRDYFVM